MTPKLKLLLYPICVLIGYVLSQFASHGQEAKIVESKGSDKKVELVQRNVTTTRTTKPTGEIVEKVVDNSTTTRDREITKSQKISVPSKNNYSLGVKAIKKFDLEPSKYELEVGYRMTGDLWGTASYNVNDKTIGIGLRIEF